MSWVKARKCPGCGYNTVHVDASKYNEKEDKVEDGLDCNLCHHFHVPKVRKTKQWHERQARNARNQKTLDWLLNQHEEVATNSIGAGHVASFDPLLGAEKKKKRMSDVMRRWMEGR